MERPENVYAINIPPGISWSAFFICLQRTSHANLGLVALETRMVNDVIKTVDPAVMTNCDELMSTEIKFSKIGHQSKLIFLI